MHFVNKHKKETKRDYSSVNNFLNKSVEVNNLIEVMHTHSIDEVITSPIFSNIKKTL